MSAKRRNFGRELWERARVVAEVDDGLPTYKCGNWTIEKLYFLSNYIAQMTHAMVGHRRFTSVNYVDLFASCGVCELKGQAGRRYPGSALLAAMTDKPFGRLILVERDEVLLDALVSRIRTSSTQTNVHTICGDCNQTIDSVVAQIPQGSLNLAFIDPFSLDIEFKTVTSLVGNNRPIDLLILFADETDLIRNVEYYRRNPNSKLDKFLGNNSGWRERWDQLQTRDASHVRQMFAEVYLNQLRVLGYLYTQMLAIPRSERPLYHLVFASRNKLGLKFWQIAESEDYGGNRGLFPIA